VSEYGDIVTFGFKKQDGPKFSCPSLSLHFKLRLSLACFPAYFNHRINLPPPPLLHPKTSASSASHHETASTSINSSDRTFKMKSASVVAFGAFVAGVVAQATFPAGFPSCGVS
jgi:hypothetical protein